MICAYERGGASGAVAPLALRASATPMLTVQV
jgi:hypothetical protein